MCDKSCSQGMYVLAKHTKRGTGNFKPRGTLKCMKLLEMFSAVHYCEKSFYLAVGLGSQE